MCFYKDILKTLNYEWYSILLKRNQTNGRNKNTEHEREQSLAQDF